MKSVSEKAPRFIIMMAAVAIVLGATSSALSPDPLAGTGYASEHGNFLCMRYLGKESPGDQYPLPCSASRFAEWRNAPLLQQFVITAWWPPTMNALDAYADAHFNVLLGGNIANGCQFNGTIPKPASQNDAFECIAKALPAVERLGLKFIFSVGFYDGMYSDQQASLVLGGAKAFGGLSDSLNFTVKGPPTTPEVQWSVEELKRRNLSHIVSGYLLRDDMTTVTAVTSASVDYLRDHAPTIVPLGNVGSMGATTQYTARLPVASPEEYAIDPALASQDAATSADVQLQLYAVNQYQGDRYRVDTWPLFQVQGSDFRQPVTPSQLRLQAYAAVAYGARGLYYYCWGNGVWNVTMPGGQFAGRGKPSPLYAVVKKANADLAKWGTALLNARHVGAIRSSPSTDEFDRSVAPSAARPVTAMDERLLVGTFALTNASMGASAAASAAVASPADDALVGYLMVVDLRVANATDPPPGARIAALTLHPACTAELVPGGDGGWADDAAAQTMAHGLQKARARPQGSAQRAAAGQRVSFSVAAGGGALLALRGGEACVRSLGTVRRWWFDPRAISLKPPNRGVFGYPPMMIKDASYDRFGSAVRHFAPGGLAGYTHDLIIGGRDGSEAAVSQAWSSAAFNLVALPTASRTNFRAALGRALAIGMFVVGAVADAVGVESLMELESCHPNLGGALLNLSSAISGAAAMRSRGGYWMVPLVPNVPTVADAVQLASADVPLAAVNLPLEANDALATLQTLAAASANTSNAMTMAVSLDACRLKADAARLRFSAYASVIFGAQAIWWEGMGECAPVGSAEFALIGTVNARLAQWGGPLFLKMDRRDALPPFVVESVFSTSSLKLPPLQGVTPRRPGLRDEDAVQEMSEELVVVQFANTSAVADRDRRRLLLVLSTGVDAGVRDVRVSLRGDAMNARPIEPDAFQGFADLPPRNVNSPPGFGPNLLGVGPCPLSWRGSEMPLRMAGGGVQLVFFTLREDWPYWGDGEGGEGDGAAWKRKGRRLVMQGVEM